MFATSLRITSKIAHRYSADWLPTAETSTDLPRMKKRKIKQRDVMTYHRTITVRLLSCVLPVVLAACGGGANTSTQTAVPNNTVQPQPGASVGDTDPTAWPPAATASPATACSSALTGSHQTYNVGPGQTYTELTDVPWLSLQAGDVVSIHYRNTPYQTNSACARKAQPRHPSSSTA